MSNLIVCGIDLSSGSERTAAVAARLAHALRSRAAAVHADGEPPGMPSVERARKLRALGALVESHGFPDGTLARLLGGEPAEALVRLAREHDAQLVVVGSRGMGELRSALFGSVSAELLRSAPCPVVLVPPGVTLPFPHPGMRPVVCGVEGAARDRDLLRFGGDVAGRLGSDLLAVHAYNPHPLYAIHAVPIAMRGLREAAEARLERALREARGRASATVVPLPAAAALAQVAEECRAGLVVVGSRGSGKLGSLLRGSVVTQLRSQVDCPLVVLPRAAEIAAGSGHYEVSAGAA
jgi:nucleotide-binding universal stress UspA family protein